MKSRVIPFLGVVVLTFALFACTHQQPIATSDTASTATTDGVTRTPSAEDADPWTDWYEEKFPVLGTNNTVKQLRLLSKIRENLLKNNLHDPHVTYIGHGNIDCSKTNTKFRSADGTCNDVSKPFSGAANVAFGRNVPPQYIDQRAAEKLMIPNPAVVSKEFFTRDEFKPVPFLNMLAAVWIQFMNHDWLTHGRNEERDPHHVKVAGAEDKVVDRTKENDMPRSQYKPAFGQTNKNEVTHWWDASQIYGSNQDAQNKVRSFSKGRMKTVVVNGHEILPRDSEFNVAANVQNQGLEVTGFRDNWWIGLSMLHTLFVKEHNAIAAELYKKHVRVDPKTKKYVWKNGTDVRVLDEAELDEQIFGTARLINAAVLAKIHTVEWTPAILPNPVLKKAMYTNWYGLANPQTWSRFIKYIPGFSKTDWFSGTASGFVIGGVVGDHVDNFGVPFSITEEFTSVYRLHSLLPEKLELKSLANKKAQPIAFQDTRNEKSYPIMASHNLKDLFYSFGTQLPGQLVLNNFPKFMQTLEIPGRPPMDLGMVDIIRDRERGVPRYNQFRRAISLHPIKTYRDFFPAGKPLDAKQQEILAKFYKVYGKDSKGNDNVEQIDLLVGTLAEQVRPEKFGFGETMFHIFILMASRRLMADRFFTDDYKPAFYTQTGMDWIDQKGRFAQVISRHMPELAPYMGQLETAFEPWKK